MSIFFMCQAQRFKIQFCELNLEIENVVTADAKLTMIKVFEGKKVWSRRESNPRPSGYVKWRREASESDKS